MCALREVNFGDSLLNKFEQNAIKHSVPNPQLSVNSINSHKKEKSIINDKTIAYVGASLALVSLGVAGVAISKNMKLMKNFGNKILELNKNLEGISSKSPEFINKLESLSSNLEKKISAVSSQSQNNISSIKTNLKDLQSKITEVATQNQSNVSSMQSHLADLQLKITEPARVFTTRKVNIDGLEMNLGTTINEISGQVEEKMRHILRTESTKRIFGLSEKLPSVPNYTVVRIPTSELKPFTQAGGLAVVPKDIASNMAAVMNGRHNGAMILDTPLYTGQAASNQFLKKMTKISDVTGKPDGTYEYVRKTFDSNNGIKIQKIATLNEVQELVVPIYTDRGVVNEKVGVYITDVMEAPVDWNVLRKRLTKEVRSDIAKAIKKDKIYETDLVKIVPNSSTGQLEAYGRYRTVFYDSPKFDLSAKLLNEGEKFNLYRNDTLATGETERMIYFSKFFTEQLYNSESSKFVLKMLDKVDEAGNVIVNKSTNKPQKEFVKLGADAIIGNDWHTGPISAILRQLSTIKKYYGMDPQLADKLQNTPIMTILHNVEYQGGVGHSQEKLLNIMFGEHSAKIVENAFMPDIAIKSGSEGLPKHLWNSLMIGKDVNPQMMAASYSDILVPVSKNYAEEIASHSGFGKSCHDIFKMRARKFEYSNTDYIKSIVTRNNLDASKVTDAKTMVGINNGCDTSNNILSDTIAKKMERELKLVSNSLAPYSKNVDILPWHNHNKRIYLEKIVKEIDDIRLGKIQGNPLKLYMPEATDLTGVTVDTPVFALAGRLEDQKALDILGKGIVEFYKNYKGVNPPVFYIQGTVADKKYLNYFLDAKKEVAKINPLGAKRMVATGLFSEPSRYEGCKIMSDFTNMPSWFEPFGLVHKENAKFNGSIPIVNEVGGLTANLEDMLNALFVKYQHRFDPNINAVEINGQNLAKVFEKAVKIYDDKPAFAKMLKESLTADHGWLVKDGPIDNYAKLLVDMNILPKSII